VAGIAFSANGAQAASVSEDGTLAIWDTSSFQLIDAFKAHMQGAHGVAFSPDSRRLATGGSGRDSVKLWDMSTHRELMTLTGQDSLFSFVAFSPDSRWLAACSREGKLHLWQAPSWEEIEAAEKQTESRKLLPVNKEAWRGFYLVKDLANIYVMSGEFDLAIDQLEFLLSVPGEMSIPLLKLDPAWDPLRDYSRFKKLLESYK
jgi:WD40 repeat protein